MTQILVVCSGNLYRSPFGAAILGAALREQGSPSSCRSAGVSAPVGRSLPRAVLDEVRRRKLDLPELANHRARQLTRDDIAASGLIIGMAREHVRAVVALQPEAFQKTYTLKELVRLVARTPPMSSLDQWCAWVHRGRSAARLIRSEPTDDIDDPIGRSSGTLRRVLDEVTTAMSNIMPLVENE